MLISLIVSMPESLVPPLICETILRVYDLFHRLSSIYLLYILRVEPDGIMRSCCLFQ